MNHEKIIKREDGTRIKLCARVYLDSFSKRGATYDISVLSCEKGKRTWRAVADTNNYEFRRLDTENRKKWITEKHLTVVSEKEVAQAKLELWEKLKPQ